MKSLSTAGVRVRGDIMIIWSLACTTLSLGGMMTVLSRMIAPAIAPLGSPASAILRPATGAIELVTNDMFAAEQGY